MNRFIVAVAAIMLVSGAAQSQQSPIPQKLEINVKKSESCGCCVAWIERLQKQNFSVKSENLALGQLMRFKLDHGISAKHASCHTARVGGYTIEGHVPVREIRRLLKERPDAIGLAVPGMPLGSPGMDFGETREAYDVLLIKKDGTSSVFASYTGTE